MNAASEILDLFKTAKGIPSDYAAAKALGVSQPNLSGWRKGKHSMSADMAAKIACEIGRDPAELVTLLEASNAPKPERKAWQESVRMQEVYRAVFEIVAGDPKMSKEVAERVKQMPAERRERIGAFLAKRGMYGAILLAMVGAGPLPGISQPAQACSELRGLDIMLNRKRKKRRA